MSPDQWVMIDTCRLYLCFSRLKHGSKTHHQIFPHENSSKKDLVSISRENCLWSSCEIFLLGSSSCVLVSWLQTLRSSLYTLCHVMPFLKCWIVPYDWAMIKSAGAWISAWLYELWIFCFLIWRKKVSERLSAALQQHYTSEWEEKHFSSLKLWSWCIPDVSLPSWGQLSVS